MIAAIARVTYHEAVRQPAFWVVTAVSGLLIALSGELALFALGEEGILLRELGISSISLATSILVFLLATRLIRDEMDERTLMTVLARPIARWQVYLGKYVGIMRAVISAAALLALAQTLLLWSYHGLPEARRAQNRDTIREAVEWRRMARQEGTMSVERIRALAPGEAPRPAAAAADYWHAVKSGFTHDLLGIAQAWLLVALHAGILASMATLLSIRLDFSMAAILGFAFFAAGNLSPYLEHMLAKAEGIVARLGIACCSLLPNLAALSMPAALAREPASLGWAYLAEAALSALLYIAATLSLGIWVFSRAEASGSRS